MKSIKKGPRAPGAGPCESTPASLPPPAPSLLQPEVGLNRDVRLEDNRLRVLGAGERPAPACELVEVGVGRSGGERDVLVGLVIARNRRDRPLYGVVDQGDNVELLPAEEHRYRVGR